MKKIFMIGILMFGLFSCQDDSQELNAKQKAEKALNNNDAQGAIDILVPYIESVEDDYEAYCLLASAYATRAGLDILSIIQSQMNPQEGGDGSDDVFSQIEAFLPDDTSEETLADINLAIASLESIPFALLDSDEKYAQSATIQLVLYLPIRASVILVLIRSGAYSTTEGLSAILESLQGTLAIPGETAVLQEAVQKTLERIESRPGETQEERLANYLNI
jgi:hypothetical protein